MRLELRRIFTIPRVAAALLLAGALLAILAVSAGASEPAPAPPSEAGDLPVQDFSSNATSVSRTALPGGPPLSPAAGAETPVPASPTIARDNEGAVALPTGSAAVVAQAVDSGGRFSLPLVDWIRVTDRYGAPRGNGLVHGGIDLAVAGHVPVLAACEGTVLSAAYSGTYGNHVLVDCGDGWSTLYGHLSSMTVESGDRVGRNTGLGRSGSTGYSTGEHLHFEIRYQGTPVNPEAYLDFKIAPGTPLSSGPIVFPRDPRSGEPGSAALPPDSSPTVPPTPTATPTVTNTPTPTATPTPTNTPTPTPTPRPPTPTPTPTPRPILR